MTIRAVGLALILAGALISGARAQQAPAADPVIGKMGNFEIKTSELRRILDAQEPDVRRQLVSAVGELDRLVRNELLRQALVAEAKTKGIDKKPDVAMLMERAKEQALMKVYLTDVSRPPASFPSDDDVKKAYEANLSAPGLMGPAQYRLAQILIVQPENADKAVASAAAKKAADLAAKAQVKGADFAKLAKENSDNKDTAPNGGDVGWLPEDRMLPELRAIVQRMEKGDVSAPIRGTNSWHIIKLVDKKPAAVRPLPEVRDAIVREMRMQRSQEIARQYLDAIAAKSQITVNQMELPKLQSAK